ncbi:MAG: lysylphosphatidylglycerol synthase transmembrane domain-containing protein [Chloroflexota bacterium]
MKDPRVLIGILISIAATAMLLYLVNPWEVLDALSHADPLLVLACAATVVLAMWTKAVRWRLFFPQPEKVRLSGLHEGLYIGYMVNTILPLRAGELVRAFLAAQTEKVSTSTSLATVLIEKVLDLGTMAVLLFVFGLILPDLPESARYAAYLSGIGLVIAIAGVVFALAARPLATRLALWFEYQIPLLAKIGVAGLLNAFLDGLSFAQKPGTLALVIFWTIVQWSISASTVALALTSVGISSAVQGDLIQMVLLVLVATNLSMAIPSAPGYVGVFHGVFVGTLLLFALQPGATPESRDRLATAAAVIEHAVVFGVFIVGGAYYLLFGEAGRASGRRLGDLVSRARSAAPEAH